MKASVSTLLFLCLAAAGFAQEQKIEVTIHARVDTTDPEIKAVTKLWTNYLNAAPDSIYNNPYWNNAEKITYADFDLSRKFIYQAPAAQILGHYKPTVLSVEKEGGYYGIRTIFLADKTASPESNSNPWCITKLHAVKENNEWKLINALPVITKKWTRKKVGEITFIYPPVHQFNLQSAKRSNEFCEYLQSKFKLQALKPFEFYITNNADDMGKLLNFDFYFAGYTTGAAMRDNNILMSGLGAEYYPHELVHMMLPDADRHSMIEEGFASWQGGSNGRTFEENILLLADLIYKNEAVTFDAVLKKTGGWQIGAYYTTGAILCKAAFETGGSAYVQSLLNTPNEDNQLIETVCKIFKIKKEDIDTFWKSKVAMYSAVH